MEQPRKNGKMPISAKPKTTKPATLDDIFGNPMSLPPEVTAAFEKAGLAYRFVNASKIIQNGGRHHRAWTPIKLAKIKDMPGCANIDLFGSDPDGYYRHGDLVLATRPKDLHQKHRAFLNQEAETAKRFQKRHAEELRQYVRENKLGDQMKVHEGFEDEGE